MFLASSCSCLYLIHWSQVLSREWRCSWSSADRPCCNDIWVTNNFFACWGASYIRGLTVRLIFLCLFDYEWSLVRCWWTGNMFQSTRPDPAEYLDVSDIFEALSLARWHLKIPAKILIQEVENTAIKCDKNAYSYPNTIPRYQRPSHRPCLQ